MYAHPHRLKFVPERASGSTSERLFRKQERMSSLGKNGLQSITGALVAEEALHELRLARFGGGLKCGSGFVMAEA